MLEKKLTSKPDTYSVYMSKYIEMISENIPDEPDLVETTKNKRHSAKGVKNSSKSRSFNKLLKSHKNDKAL